MRKIFLALALIVLSVACSAAFAANVAFQHSAGAIYASTATCGNTALLTPAAGNDLILIVRTYAASTVLSVSNSQGATVIQDVPFASNLGVYRVHNATAVSQSITVTFTASTTCYAWLIEASGVGLFDQNAAVNTGTGTAFTTNALTPAVNGAMLLAVGSNVGSGITYGSWQNGFTALTQHDSAGPVAYAAYLNQSTQASVYAGATISSSVSWAGNLLDYIPAASFSPHPVLSHGKVLLSNGKIVN